MLAVLNPGGRDRFQTFPDGAGEVDEAVHAPVNYHGYAACRQGVFCRAISEIPEEIRDVVLLLRGDFQKAHAALSELRQSGRTVALAFKEAGVHQVAEKLGDATRLGRFLRLCGDADRALASTPELVTLFRGAGVEKVEFIPTPYPLEDARWDFSRPAEQQDGIFIGTREFDVPSRQHAGALLAARELSMRSGQPVTVINLDGRRGRARLEALDFPALYIEEDFRPYPEYLRLMARHRLVFQLDHSAVPGQVAGDALLCRIPCLGGDGAIDRLVRGSADPLETAARLLEDEGARLVAVGETERRARAAVSFEAVAASLRRFFQSEENA